MHGGAEHARAAKTPARRGLSARVGKPLQPVDANTLPAQRNTSEPEVCCWPNLVHADACEHEGHARDSAQVTALPVHGSSTIRLVFSSVLQPQEFLLED